MLKKTRLIVMTGCINYMNNIHLQPIYFFLVAEKNGPYDKNILPHKDAMWKLVNQHAIKIYKLVYIHPGKVAMTDLY